MLPVFIWRARQQIFACHHKLRAVSSEEACALGYFLELTSRLGGENVASEVLPDLRRKTKTVADPIVLFHLMDRPRLREFAVENSSSLAKSWNLVLGEPDESFESYFKKMEANA
jgi:hypothetical protein